jgi:hypothetical protein
MPVEVNNAQYAKLTHQNPVGAGLKQTIHINPERNLEGDVEYHQKARTQNKRDQKQRYLDYAKSEETKQQAVEDATLRKKQEVRVRIHEEVERGRELRREKGKRTTKDAKQEAAVERAQLREVHSIRRACGESPLTRAWADVGSTSAGAPRAHGERAARGPDPPPPPESIARACEEELAPRSPPHWLGGTGQG